MDVADFDYELPAERIAQVPIEPRHAARLLVQRPRTAGDAGTGVGPAHRHVVDLPQELEPGDLVVVNDTRVLPARLHLQRSTGGRVEVLLVAKRAGRTWQALARPSRRLRPGERLSDGRGLVVELGEHLGEGRWTVTIGGDEPVEDLLAAHGEVPLPPYITTALADPERYQTVFAARPGSVAAPTAGLHLTDEVLAGLAARGVEVVAVELEVGLGTFRPITAGRVADHVMHAETYRISPEVAERVRAAARVVAVGTTVVRTLESWAASGRLAGQTELFIWGDYPFAVVDRLVTNFHVPRSSLLVLVDAFLGGAGRWRQLYETALADRYRFLSFGDAMLIDRAHRP